MAKQIAVNVYGMDRKPLGTVELYSFLSSSKFTPDKLTGVPQVYSRITFLDGRIERNAYVAETIDELATLAGSSDSDVPADAVLYDDGTQVYYTDSDYLKYAA